MKYRKPVKVRGGYRDHYGRVWPYPKNELCPVCGQPDSCGDCNHKKLTDADVAQILYEEKLIPLPNGGSLRCGPGKEHQWGGYVRICDENGKEIVYWDVAEWEEDSESVMGAIFSAAMTPLDELKASLNRTHVVGDHWE